MNIISVLEYGEGPYSIWIKGHPHFSLLAYRRLSETLQVICGLDPEVGKNWKIKNGLGKPIVSGSLPLRPQDIPIHQFHWTIERSLDRWKRNPHHSGARLP